MTPVPPETTTTSAYTGEDGAPQPEAKEWPTLLSIKNNVGTVTSEVRPWEFKPDVPAHIKSRDDYRAWRKEVSTEHLCYSETCGIYSGVRQNSENNPVTKIRALIADFDSRITDENCLTLLDRCPADLRPTWLSRTFSGGARLMWLFSESVPFDGTIAKQFYKVAGDELRLKKIFAGLDEGAWADPYRFYDVGTSWRQLSDKPLSSNIVHHWLFEAAKETDWSRVRELQIPFEDVREEVLRQFEIELPDVNGRTHRFWTIGDVGTDDTAAVVLKDGMFCFSNPGGFTSWSKLLGPPFCRKYQADKISRVTAEVWYDGRAYYRKIGSHYEEHSTDAFRKWLRHVGIKDTKGSGHNQISSEADDTEIYLDEHRRIAGLIPKPYSKDELIYRKGKRYLNSATIQVTPYADEQQEWGINFPWLAEFLTNCWEPGKVYCPQDSELYVISQRDIFFTWYQRFYLTALQGDLESGHCLFLVGPPNAGKSLIGSLILSESMGGHADASDSLLDGSKFNKELGEAPLWLIDDDEAKEDPAGFVTKIKKTVANPSLALQAKYKDQVTTESTRRLVVCINDDETSLRMVPDMVDGMRDKALLLRFNDKPRQYPSTRAERQKIVRSELPYLLRWLVDWQAPAEIADTSRFGMRTFVHNDTRLAAVRANLASDLLQWIDVWASRCKLNGVEWNGGEWEGKAGAWLAIAKSDDALRNIVTVKSVSVMGKKFAAAASLPDSGVTAIPDPSRRGSTRYRIDTRRPDEPKNVLHVPLEVAKEKIA